MRYRHIKTRLIYRVLAVGTDCTNVRDGLPVVIYCQDGDERHVYVRALEEFEAKFRRVTKQGRWRNIRDLMIKLSKNRCQHCGCDGYATQPLEVHHKTYERLGRELIEGLQVLCKQCHKVADEKRAEEGRIKSINARANAIEEACYYNGLDTFMTKKYGEHWDLDGRDHQEFDSWLERRQQD